MPAHDIFSTDNRSTTRDVSDDDVSDEDAESDYQSCESYISDADEERTAENHLDVELGIFQLADGKWKPIQESDVQDLTKAAWISKSKLDQQIDAVVDVRERSLDAVAVLAETVGGIAREWQHQILSHQEKHGS
ncbi:hypothetical protein BDZ89DRAFT_1075938, partial [Hymenopellis radicata]